MFRRRALLAGAPVPFAATAQAATTLREAARARGIVFGTAVRFDRLRDDPSHAALVAREAELLVPEWEGKWEAVQPREGVFDFAALRGLAGFARAHRQRLRGHALIWHVSNPPWLIEALREGEARAAALMEAHVGAVLQETRTTIRDWDVLNEVVANPPGSDNPSTPDGDLRPTPWLAALGPGYLERALRTARAIDGTLRLTLNDYGVEEDTPWAEEKRRRLLRVVRGLLARGVPLDAVGIQAHLQMRQPFRPDPFLALLRALRESGLAVAITELDIREPDRVPDDLAARDAAVAAHAARFLEAALEGGARTVLTWGLSDRDSWLTLQPEVARADGHRHRGLPFDDQDRPKPMHAAMLRVLAGG